MVTLHVYTNVMEDVLRLPGNALFHHPDRGYYVYKIENNQHIQTPLTVGTRTETYAAVLNGLNEGDEVYVRR